MSFRGRPRGRFTLITTLARGVFLTFAFTFCLGLGFAFVLGFAFAFALGLGGRPRFLGFFAVDLSGFLGRPDVFDFLAKTRCC